MKNLKFFVIIFLDELGLLLSILGFFKDFLEISLISLISANLPLPFKPYLKKKKLPQMTELLFPFIIDLSIMYFFLEDTTSSIYNRSLVLTYKTNQCSNITSFAVYLQQ